MASALGARASNPLVDDVPGGRLLDGRLLLFPQASLSCSPSCHRALTSSKTIRRASKSHFTLSCTSSPSLIHCLSLIYISTLIPRVHFEKVRKQVIPWSQQSIHASSRPIPTATRPTPIATMSAVPRDPLFWKRFSVALHKVDEEHGMGKPEQKNPYVP